MTTFFESTCEIKDAKSRLVASGYREGSLYYLDYEGATQLVHSIRRNENVKKGIVNLATWVYNICSHLPKVVTVKPALVTTCIQRPARGPMLKTRQFTPYNNNSNDNIQG